MIPLHNTPEMNLRIALRIQALYRLDRTSLQDEVNRTHRIVDLRSADKGLLVSMIMEAEYGARRMNDYFEFDAQTCKKG